MPTTPRRTDDPLIEALGAEIRIEAIRRKMPVRVIAERSGIPYSTLAKTINGQRMTDVVEVQLIAKALGTTASVLLERALETVDQWEAEARAAEADSGDQLDRGQTA